MLPLVWGIGSLDSTLLIKNIIWLPLGHYANIPEDEIEARQSASIVSNDSSWAPTNSQILSGR